MLSNRKPGRTRRSLVAPPRLPVACLLVLTACLCPSAAQAKAGVSFSLRAASGYRGYQVPLHSLMYSGGQPLSGKSVDFSVDGTYVGTAVSGSTEVALAWTIPADMPSGLHDVTVSFAGDDDYYASERTAAALTVLKNGVSFSLRDASGYRGTQTTLRTLLYSGGAPLAGKSVNFAVDGVYAGTAVSGSTEVDIPWTVWSSLTPAAHDLTVSFAGDNDYTAASRTTVALTVNAAASDTSLDVPDTVSGLMGTQVTLHSVLRSGAGALAGKSVEFKVDDTSAGSAASDASGVSLAYTIPTNMSAGAHTVTVMFAGDAQYNPSTASSAVLTVSYPDAPSYCAAYATSATSIRVYWETVEGATEYRIYRATDSGGYNFASPAAVVPVVTGDEHFYDDSGLTTDQDYYYVVKAVVNGAESQASEEDSHFPNTSAIPWNLGQSQIMTADWNSMNSEGLALDPGVTVGAGNNYLLSPDGVSYSDAGMPLGWSDALVDTPNWRMIVRGREFAVAEKLPWQPNPKPKPGQTPVNVPSGPFRRVRTAAGGYTGVSGTYYLPPWGTSDFYVLEGPRPVPDNSEVVTETPYAYIGCDDSSDPNHQFHVDAGVMYCPAEPSIFAGRPALPRRWATYLRVVDGGWQSNSNPPYRLLSARAIRHDENPTMGSFVTAENDMGNTVFEALFFDTRKRIGRLYVFGTDAWGTYVAKSISAAMKFKCHSGQPFGALQWKRVISLAQVVRYGSNAAASRGVFTNHLLADPNAEGEGQHWYHSLLSHYNPVFGDARLWYAGTAYSWPEVVNDGTAGGDFYAMPVVTKGGYQEQSVIYGGQPEWCDIWCY